MSYTSQFVAILKNRRFVMFVFGFQLQGSGPSTGEARTHQHQASQSYDGLQMPLLKG